MKFFNKVKYPDSQILFEGSRFDVISVKALHPIKGMVEREIVDHPGAVVILPFIDSDNILLIENYRYSVQKKLWELPAGTLEINENTLECAHRELIEETGFKAEIIEPLFCIYPCPGFCNEILYVFSARKLSFVGQKLDETEQIVCHQISFINALEMIKENKICDGKTISTLLYFHLFKYNDIIKNINYI